MKKLIEEMLEDNRLLRAVIRWQTCIEDEKEAIVQYIQYCEEEDINPYI